MRNTEIETSYQRHQADVTPLSVKADGGVWPCCAIGNWERQMGPVFASFYSILSLEALLRGSGIA